MGKAPGDPPDKAADLSEAARAVVRDAGDPRIDAHLAALGLLPTEAPAEEAQRSAEPAEPAVPVEHPELATLRARVGELDAALAAARRQVRWLTGALLVALAGLAIAAVLLVSRTG